MNSDEGMMENWNDGMMERKNIHKEFKQ